MKAMELHRTGTNNKNLLHLQYIANLARLHGDYSVGQTKLKHIIRCPGGTMYTELKGWHASQKL